MPKKRKGPKRPAKRRSKKPGRPNREVPPGYTANPLTIIPELEAALAQLKQSIADLRVAVRDELDADDREESRLDE